VPRAALLADELAKEAEFMSFGTNDLTQVCFAISIVKHTQFAEFRAMIL
jgi:phosphoenolpyruvate-protein kinase (PTS system EI component)